MENGTLAVSDCNYYASLRDPDLIGASGRSVFQLLQICLQAKPQAIHDPSVLLCSSYYIDLIGDSFFRHSKP